MKRLWLLAALLAGSAVVAAVGACGFPAQTEPVGSNSPAASNSSAAVSPSAGAPATAAQLPAVLRFTKVADLGAGPRTFMGGPAISTSEGLWIVSVQKSQLTKVTASGSTSPVDLPALPAGATPQGIALASDGSIWISESNSVLRVGSDRKVTTFAIAGQPNSRIVEGRDNAIWVAELGKDRIARIMNGQVQEFPLPAASMQVQCGGRCPYGITSGPDGNLWITESQLGPSSWVGRMTTAGEYQHWPLAEQGAALNDITAGPDGALWFGEGRGRRLGRITTAGVVTEQVVELPAHAIGTRLVSGSDRLIWYAPVLSPADSEDPITVGAALPGGASRVYEIAGTKGPVAGFAVLRTPQGEVVDVITWSGEVWQAVST